MIELTPEDHAYVLFLDMLGFSALTEAYPDRRTVKTVDTDDEERTMDLVVDSPASSQFDVFHSVLDGLLDLWESPPRNAMIFSDCAGRVCGDSTHATVSD